MKFGFKDGVENKRENKFKFCFIEKWFQSTQMAVWRMTGTF